MKKPAAVQILETIPEHVFWDIKKPIGLEETKFMN